MEQAQLAELLPRPPRPPPVSLALGGGTQHFIPNASYADQIKKLFGLV